MNELIIDITLQAAKKMQVQNCYDCCIVIKRGGCFGYTAKLLLENHGQLACIQHGINIYTDGDVAFVVSTSFLIDYQSSLIKEGFVIKSLDTQNCCCNKSFGRMLNKKNCLS